MYKYILYTFLFLTGSVLMAQDIGGYVIGEDGRKISFVSIYLKNKNIGVVSNVAGQYRLPSSILSEIEDTLIFSSIGFETQRIPVSVFKENVLAGNTNILLGTNYVLLPEVVVTPNVRSPKEYGMFHLRSSSPSFHFSGKPSSRLMVFVENTDSINKIIQSVNIGIRKDDDETKKLRLFFVKNTGDGFQVINVADEDIFITDFSSSRIRHDVSKHHIPFPKEGIYIGIEWIGEENTVQERSQRFGLSIGTTTRANKPHTWLFIDENWVQFPNLTEEEMEEIPRMFRRTIRNANARIGIIAR